MSQTERLSRGIRNLEFVSEIKITVIAVVRVVAAHGMCKRVKLARDNGLFTSARVCVRIRIME